MRITHTHTHTPLPEPERLLQVAASSLDTHKLLKVEQLDATAGSWPGREMVFLCRP